MKSALDKIIANALLVILPILATLVILALTRK